MGKQYILMELYEIRFCNWKKKFYLICTKSKWPLMIFIWFGYVLILVDTVCEMSTVTDAMVQHTALQYIHMFEEVCNAV